MKNNEGLNPISQEEGKRLFKQMREALDKTEPIVPSGPNTGAGAMHAWEAEKERKEDERNKNI